MLLTDGAKADAAHAEAGHDDGLAAVLLHEVSGGDVSDQLRQPEGRYYQPKLRGRDVQLRDQQRHAGNDDADTCTCTKERRYGTIRTRQHAHEK